MYLPLLKNLAKQLYGINKARRYKEKVRQNVCTHYEDVICSYKDFVKQNRKTFLNIIVTYEIKLIYFEMATLIILNHSYKVLIRFDFKPKDI